MSDFLSSVPCMPSPCSAPVLLFEHNVEHVVWRRLAQQARGWRRPMMGAQWRKVKRYERRACREATVTVAVSEEDRATVARLAPNARVRAVPTGVGTRYFAPDGAGASAASGAGLAFVGSLDRFPNEDAARWLIEAILPEVRRELPMCA